MAKLLQARYYDILVAWILSRSAFLKKEPGQRDQKPYPGSKCDQHAQPPVVILLAVINPQAKHDPHDDSQDEYLCDRLDVERDVGQPTALETVGVIIFFARDMSGNILFGFGIHLRSIARQPRERRHPESQSRLVGDQPDNVEPYPDVPFIGRMNAQPAKSNPISNYRQADEDVWSPFPEISETSNDEENDDLDGERYAVAEEDYAVNGALPTGEKKGFLLPSGLIEEVLEGCRAKVWSKLLLTNFSRSISRQKNPSY